MYSPKMVPNNPTQLPGFLQQEHADIAAGIVSPVKRVQFEILYAAPVKLTPGMVVYADGTSWNPGSGEGLYRRTLAGAWAFVG